MSLNVSRRDFMKLSAAAALTVAASGLLAGCSDPNKPTRKGDGKLTLLSAETTVERAGAGTFEVTIKNKRSNDLKVDADSFRVIVTNGDKSTAYNATISNASEGWAIKKGDTFTTTVTSSAPVGQTVTLQFRPDDAYDEMYASWIYE